MKSFPYKKYDVGENRWKKIPLLMVLLTKRKINMIPVSLFVFKTHVNFDIRPKGKNSNPVFHRQHDLIFFLARKDGFSNNVLSADTYSQKNDICCTKFSIY